jgi:hypothetical protein
MGRPRKQQPAFADALAIWLETADEQEIRDGMVMSSIYVRQRKLGFAVRVETIKQQAQIELKEKE